MRSETSPVPWRNSLAGRRGKKQPWCPWFYHLRLQVLCRSLTWKRRAKPRDGFLELNQGIDPRAPELQPRPLPPDAPLLLEYSLQMLSLPQNLRPPLPWASDPDFLFPGLDPGPHSTPGTHWQVNECCCGNKWKSALTSCLPHRHAPIWSLRLWPRLSIRPWEWTANTQRPVRSHCPAL